MRRHTLEGKNPRTYPALTLGHDAGADVSAIMSITSMPGDW